MDDLDRLYHRLLDAVRESAPQLRERRFRLGDIPQHLLPYRLHRRELGFDSVQQYEGALARLAAGERGYLSADATVQQAFRRAVDGGDVPLEQALRQHGDALVALTPEARHRPETPVAAAPAVPATPDAPVVPDAMVSAPAATGNAPGAGGLVIPIVRAEEADEVSSARPAARPAPEPEPSPAVASDGGAEALAANMPAAGAPANDAFIAAAIAAMASAPPSSAAAPPSPSAAPAMPFPVRPPTPVVGGTCRNCGRPLPADRGVTFCPYCGENLTIRRCPACSTELESGWRFCITCGREVDEPAAAGAPTGGTPGDGSPG